MPRRFINPKRIIVRRKKKLTFLKFLKPTLSLWLVFLLTLQIVGGVLFLPPIEEAQAIGENWLTGWDYRRAITLSSATSVADYQVKVILNTTIMSSPYTNINADGSDIFFTNTNGTSPIDYWIESWDNTGNSKIWVEVPDIIGTDSNKIIYMYYGNAGASSASNGTNTFKLYNVSGIKGFWHLDEDSWSGTSGEVKDETGVNNGTANGGVNTTADGKFKRAGSFDGTDDYINCGNHESLNITDAITVEAWVKKSTPGTPSGTAITNCTELQNMEDNLSGDYYLANNIDCSDTVNWNSGAGFEPIGTSSNQFTGTFDGQGYKITGLFINRASTNYVGLFGHTDSGSEIKNVGLENVNMTGTTFVGGLVGISMGTITNSYTTGDVTGDYDAGGLVGDNYGTITNSYFTGSVTGDDYIGGLVGISMGTITNSYTTGDVTENEAYRDGWGIGGLVGYNDNVGTINNSYSTGYIDAGAPNDVGGLVGGTNFGTVSDSYWDNETSGQSTSAGGTGKTTTQMKQQATFVGWNFTDDWSIEETITYPFLYWQWDYLVSKGRDAYSLQTNRDGSVFYGYINNSVILTSVSQPTNWHHFVITFNGANQKLFIDGDLKNTISHGGAIGSNVNNITIGGFKGYFNGTIDEVRIYNRALDASEISTIYNNYMQKMGSYYNIRKYVSPEPSFSSIGDQEEKEILPQTYTQKGKFYKNLTNTVYSTGDVFYPKEPNPDDLISLLITPSFGQIEITIEIWQISGDYYKKWKEEASSPDITAAHTIGDLKEDTKYQVFVNSELFGTYTSNSNGEISFTYNKGYSEKTFEVKEEVAGAETGEDLAQTGEKVPNLFYFLPLFLLTLGSLLCFLASVRDPSLTTQDDDLF